MKAFEMWEAFRKERPDLPMNFDSWAFGVDADHLAQLVLTSKKTATTSGYDLYDLAEEELPREGSYDVILDSQDQAVCIIEVTKVTVLPFAEVTAEHAAKEGEGDLSLDYWRRVHQELFADWYEEEGLTFTPESKVVLEEFQVVYPK